MVILTRYRDYISKGGSRRKEKIVKSCWWWWGPLLPLPRLPCQHRWPIVTLVAVRLVRLVTPYSCYINMQVAGPLRASKGSVTASEEAGRVPETDGKSLVAPGRAWEGLSLTLSFLCKNQVYKNIRLRVAQNLRTFLLIVCSYLYLISQGEPKKHGSYKE